MKIKKGDMVVVIAGADKGTVPHRVLTVVDGGKKLIVEGINRAQKHVRRGHPKSPQGGRLQIEVPIDASNVQLQCPACNSPSRVGVRYTADGAKERFCKKCSGTIGQMSPAKPKYAKG